MQRVLLAYSKFEPNLGYVQGVSFVAAGVMYHAGEVATFWLLIALMDKYCLKEIYKPGLPGVRRHEMLIRKLGNTYLSELFAHFADLEIPLDLFTTDWIMSIFLNYIPLELNVTFLNKFLEEKWSMFYRMSIALLKYFEPKLLQLDDFMDIVGQIKQARPGREHMV